MNTRSETISNEEDIDTFKLNEDGNFPNNRQLPVLLYHNVLKSADDIAGQFESLITSNHWSGAWRNGIFPYHHYHSNAHEVLAIYSGSVTVQLGGPNGKTVDLEAGDVVILPAGTAHKRLSSSGNFGVIGAYPSGQENYDINYGRDGERPESDRNIKQVPMPEADPIYGDEGPVVRHWINK